MKRIINVFLVIMAFCLILTGCNNEKVPEEAQGSALVIIVGNHANAKAISSSIFEKHKNIINNAYTLSKESNGTFSATPKIKVMVADGNPEFESYLGGFSTETLYGSKSVDNRGLKIDDNNKALLNFLTSGELKAQDEEVDLTKALREAAIYLNSTDGEKNILLLDTLLPTKGIINFTQLDFQEFSGRELLEEVKRIDSTGSLPDLEGINIIVDGALDVCGDQTDRIRDEGPSAAIIGFWKEFFGDSLVGDIRMSADGGAEQLYIEDEDGNADSNGYPYVTPIAVASPVSSTSLVFKGSELRFLPYSDEFVDEPTSIKYICDTAGDTLRKILKDDPDRVIYVVGSVARIQKTDNQKTSHYSEIRATRVSDILISECGIPSKNIKSIDAGMINFSWRNTDEFKYPDNEEEIAARRAENRTVAIICGGENCSEYKEVMAALAEGAKEIN